MQVVQNIEEKHLFHKIATDEVKGGILHTIILKSSTELK